MKNSIYSITICIAIVSFISCEVDLDKPTVVYAPDYTIEILDLVKVGDTIGVIPGTSNEGSVKFDIISQNPAGAFSVDSNYGELVVLDPDLVKASLNPQITLTVNVSKENLTETSNVTIDLIECANVDLSLWDGKSLNFDSETFFPFTATGIGTALDCGVLEITGGEFLLGDCPQDGTLNLSLKPSANDPTVGTVIIDKNLYACGLDVIGTGDYDSNTGTINISYDFFPPGGNDPIFGGTTTITIN